MKKNIFFLTLFLLIGCAPNKAIVTKISCPSVFFSTEHNTYIRGNTEPITVENLRYIANINNFKFISDCSIIDNKFEAKLSILFIVKPEQTKTKDILLPFYRQSRWHICYHCYCWNCNIYKFYQYWRCRLWCNAKYSRYWKKQ